MQASSTDLMRNQLRFADDSGLTVVMLAARSESVGILKDVVQRVRNAEASIPPLLRAVWCGVLFRRCLFCWGDYSGQACGDSLTIAEGACLR